MLVQLQLIVDNDNAADLLNGVFAILISVTRMIKIQKSLLFHKVCQKKADIDVTKETLNCTASL